MRAQFFCSLQELVDDIRLNGIEPGLFSYIQAASAYIARKLGDFIPVTETRTFGENDNSDLLVDPLLAVTSITNEAATISDYTLYPMNRHWPSGPYSRIHQDGVWSDDDVDIAGRWGMFEDTEALGVNITQATSSETTLVSTDGSKLSPGMVVIIESEQELVSGFGALTTATSQLNGATTASAADVTVDNGAEFFAGEIIRVGTEDMHIDVISGNVLTVKRGYNGTVPASHLTDTAIYVYRTFTVTRGVNGTTAAAHSNKAVSRCSIPADVNWLCRQIAGLMRAKARSEFIGRTGNSMAGVTDWFNEFPDQVKEIKANYRILSI